MIPALSLIIGCYVITRMADILTREPKAHPLPATCAVLTTLITVVALLDIMTGAAMLTEQLGSFGIPQP